MYIYLFRKFLPLHIPQNPHTHHLIQYFVVFKTTLYYSSYIREVFWSGGRRVRLEKKKKKRKSPGG